MLASKSNGISAVSFLAAIVRSLARLGGVYVAGASLDPAWICASEVYFPCFWGPVFLKVWLPRSWATPVRLTSAKSASSLHHTNYRSKLLINTVLGVRGRTRTGTAAETTSHGLTGPLTKSSCHMRRATKNCVTVTKKRQKNQKKNRYFFYWVVGALKAF